MDFSKDGKVCQECADYEICVLYTGHGCIQEMKTKVASLKQKQYLNKHKT